MKISSLALLCFFLSLPDTESVKDRRVPRELTGTKGKLKGSKGGKKDPKKDTHTSSPTPNPTASPTSSPTSSRKFKNVIMLIPDGCDEGVLSLARWYKNEPLQVDELLSGKVHPYMANSLMTDSAPGGTAYSSGQRTTDKFIAVGPRRDDLLSSVDESTLWAPYAPIPTTLEFANALGMSTGLISTSRVTHATPAAFASHVDSRSKEQEIAKQMVYNNVDVVMGGGRRNMLPDEDCFPADVNPDVSGSRSDCLDLEAELAGRGYDLCFTKDELMALDGEKAWCSFSSSHMAPDIDRKYNAQDQPSIAEMTQKAIEILSKNDEGFFLMVEGSQVDWAGHYNDPIWMVTDFIAWDDSVKVAVDWAKVNEDTVVMALPDHNTGGLRIGNYKYNYLDRTVESAREPLLKMKMTSGAVVALMQDDTVEALKAAVQTYWGIALTDEDATAVMEYGEKYGSKYESWPGHPNIPLNMALSRIVSEEYTIAGWSSHGHNGDDVPMWVYGMDPPKQTIENIDVGLIVADLMGGLDELNESLYVDLDTTGLQYEVNTDEVTNLHAIVEGFVFPLDTDYFLNGDNRVMTPGITVYAPKTGKLYISAEAIAMVNDLK